MKNSRKIRDTPTTTRVTAMIVTMIDSTVAGSKATLIHSRVPTPRSPAGMLPNPRKTANSRLTVRCRKCWNEPVSLVRVAKVRSVPTAVGAGTPTTPTRKGVISEPPPTPVRPTRKPTSRPNSAGAGSTIMRPCSYTLLSAPTGAAKVLEVADDPGRALFSLLVGLDVQFGSLRRLVRVGDAGELRDLPRECPLVEALDVTLGAHLQRSIDEDLDEILAHVLPDLVAHLLEGRDGADDHSYPVACQQVGHEPDPQYVGVPVLPGEPETLGQIGPHDVPVQNLDLAGANP